MCDANEVITIEQLDSNLSIANCDYPPAEARQEMNKHFIKWKESQSRHHNPPHYQNPAAQSFDDQTTPNFEKFIKKLKENKQLILSGSLKDIIKTPKIPPMMTPNREPDKEDFYWQDMLEDLDIVTKQHPRKSFEQSPKFLKDFLSQNLPTAPNLEPFFYGRGSCRYLEQSGRQWQV